MGLGLLGGLIWGVLLGKDAYKSWQNDQVDRQYVYKLPNGVEYYSTRGGRIRLSDGARLFWEEGMETSYHQKVIVLKTGEVVYDSEKWRESQVDRSAYMRFRIKKNLRVSGDLNMIYDDEKRQFISWIKKITILDTGKVFYKAYRFYDPNYESVVKRCGYCDPYLCIKAFSYSSSDNSNDRGYIIEDKYVEEILGLTKKRCSVKYVEEKYKTMEEYNEKEWRDLRV